MNLNILILVPVATALGIIAVTGLSRVRMIALAGALVQFVLSFVLFFSFKAERAAGNDDQFVFTQYYQWFPSLNINYQIGVDGISVAMIMLTAFVVLAGVLISWRQEKWSKEYFLLLILLSTGAYGFFVALDLFTLFFFLEVAVIPKFLLIGIWGSGKKEYAAMKLALMLMGGSALVFVGLAGTYFFGGQSFDLSSGAHITMDPEKQMFFFPFLFVGFGIFTALFPFHTWVPDGHSSAPTAASMFLAGISMKLGGYGCLRAATWLMPEAAHAYQPLIITLAAIAIIYGAFATLMQTDLKYINAYSSVSHCGFVLMGIGMLNETAINGAVLQMVSHGLMTALFFAAIGMVYDRTHTRMVKDIGGLLKITPFIGTIFILAGLCSLGLPGMSGFVAEMTVFMGSWQQPETMYRVATILACASIVVTAVYILRAAGKTMMGPLVNPAHAGFTDAKWNERTAAIVLLAGILIMGLAPFIITDIIYPGTHVLMDKIASGVTMTNEIEILK